MIAANTIQWLNSQDRSALQETLLRCCGSRWWCEQVAGDSPFADSAALHEASDRAMDAMPRDAWLEALESHPKIGDLESLRMKYAGNKEWSGGEQAGVNSADEATLVALAEGNETYEQRFGYLFVVCATGKSAAEMLALLQERLGNEADEEFTIACGEQRKITHLRLDKLEPSA